MERYRTISRQNGEVISFFFAIYLAVSKDFLTFASKNYEKSMSIARYTLICSLKSAHREVRHNTNKRLIDCVGLHLESLFVYLKPCRSVPKINSKRSGKISRTLFFCLVPNTWYRSHCRQNRRRNRCDNLHNPLKSFLLRHNRLIVLMVNRMGESRSPRPLFPT